MLSQAAGLLLAVAFLPACGGQRADGERPPPRHTAFKEIGLEARIWRVGAADATLPRLLAPFTLQESEIDPADRRRWRAGGFRLVQLPGDRIDTVEAALPHAAAVRRHWLGQPTRWTRLSTHILERSVVLETPAGERRFEPGRLELLTRSWVEPEIRGGPVFRLELAVAWNPGPNGPQAVDALLFSKTLPAGEALAVVPAPPGEDWTLIARRAAQRSAEEAPAGPEPEAETDGGVAPLPPPEADAEAPAPGPTTPAPDTLGEAMLITPPVTGERPVPARRDVFVLIPNWPER